MQRLNQLFLVLFVLFSINAIGQFSKGTRMTGASVASIFFTSNKSDYSFPPPTAGYTSSKTSYGLSLTPNMGWFINDNTVIGARLALGYNHDKTVDDANGNTFNKNTYTNFKLGIGGFVRNYFSTSGKLMPFGQFSLDAGTGSSQSEGFTYFAAGYKDTYDGKSSGDFFTTASLSIGFTKMLNDHTGLDLYAGYTFSYNKNTFTSTTQRDSDLDGDTDETLKLDQTLKNTGHGFIIGAGLQIFLDKKKIDSKEHI